MNYPSDFDVSVVPSARSTAISRVMAIWAVVLFAVVIFLCVILLWSARSRQVAPFLISIDDNGVWRAIGQNNRVLGYSANHTMQEYVVNRFVRNWFDISTNPDLNTAAWKSCLRTECGNGDSVVFGAKNCAISCGASDEVYTRFANYTLPGYRALAAGGESWRVDADTVRAIPAGQITSAGGTWDISADIATGTGGVFRIRAIAKVARNMNYYPLSMGFYIADFNSYRVE